MKIGIIFENQRELEEKLHPAIIATTWAGMNMDSLYDSNLHLHRKFFLKSQGVDENMFNTCKHLITTAKNWNYKGTPNGTCVSVEEYNQWEILFHITQLLVESDRQHLETLKKYVKV